MLHACNDTRITPGTQSQQLFTELQPDREYLVEIKAATKRGYGPSAFVQKMAGKYCWLGIMMKFSDRLSPGRLYISAVISALVVTHTKPTLTIGLLKR